MATSIDKLIHKVNSSTANLTCILTNGIAYQFVYINFHEGWICTLYNVREHCYFTRWTFSFCPICFEIMYCMAIFFCFCSQFCKLQARDLNCLPEILYPDTEIVCNTFLIVTDPIKHPNKVSGRRFFLITLSQREGGEEEREICTICNFFTFTLF